MLFMSSNIWAQWNEDGIWRPISFNEETVPPQILEWYNPDIISRNKPTCYHLKNTDIWNLPQTSGVDIVVLDFLKIHLLTPIQIQKLQNWIRNGIDVSIFPESFSGSSPLEKSEFLFGFKGKKFPSTPVQKKFYLNRKCIINTDIIEEKLNLRYTKVMTNLPKETLVIISRDKDLDEAIMGVIHYGKGRIVFSLLREWGNLNYTRSRLQLNLSQWLIGKDIPILTLKDIQEGFVLAKIKLEDGQELFGKVSKPTDTHVRFENLKRKMTLPWKGIQWIEIKDENFRAKIPEFIPLYPKRD